MGAIFAPEMHEYTINIYASAFVRWLGRALSRDETRIISTLERLLEKAREAGKTRGVALAEGDNIFHGHCAFEQGQKQHVGHNAVGHGLMEVARHDWNIATSEEMVTDELSAT